MAVSAHWDTLMQGVVVWNRWRQSEPAVSPDLSDEDLSGSNLGGVNFGGADLRGTTLAGARLTDADLSSTQLEGCLFDAAWLTAASFVDAEMNSVSMNQARATRADFKGARLRLGKVTGVDFERANLSGVDLSEANLFGSSLRSADLTGARLRGANLTSCDLSDADLTDADLTEASLVRAVMVNSRVENADLSDAHVYGVSAWDLKGQPLSQRDLVVTRSHFTGWNLQSETPDDPVLRIDNLRVAQFIYLILNNSEIRDVIDTVTSKVVLILGRFSPERKVVLDAIRTELRSRNLTPVVFDFDVPADRDVTETVGFLARMSRFIVADLTDASSIPLELQSIAPDVAVPICSIVHQDQRPFSMFRDLRKYPWVLEPYRYTSRDQLIADIAEAVIDPADAKRAELDRKTN